MVRVIYGDCFYIDGRQGGSRFGGLIITPAGNAECDACSYKRLAIGKEKCPNPNIALTSEIKGPKPEFNMKNQCPKCLEINDYWGWDFDNMRQCPACGELFLEEDYKLISEGEYQPQAERLKLEPAERKQEENQSPSQAQIVGLSSFNTFINPTNGYTVKVSDYAGVWCFFFGSLYLAYKGCLIEALLVMILHSSLVGFSVSNRLNEGDAWAVLLISSFFISVFSKNCIKQKYAEKGWIMKRT